MQVTITRHGETEENKAKILMGQLPGKLSEKGIFQAQKLGLRLKDEPFTHIYSSDLARTLDTAQEISKYHPNIPFESTSELRERNLGELQGKSKAELGLDPNVFLGDLIETKEGETMADLYKRASWFLEKLLKKHHNNDNILLCWHNGINTALTAVLLWKPHTEITTIGKQANAGITIFDIDNAGNASLSTFNCTKHLD